jgi:cation diffusion facilitator CzcD-associated flavoprotein CzcO
VKPRLAAERGAGPDDTRGRPRPPNALDASACPHVHVAVVGSGFAGIGAAVRLKEAGFDDLVVFERADDVGGVWRDNRYPGAACDVQSHLYELSFAPNPGWSRRFSPQPEIWDYLRDVAARFGVFPHVRFRHDVTEAAWDDGAQRWRIETSGGAYTADVLVAAPGALAEPRLPDIPGLDCFEGGVLHSARWDETLDLTGKRVAVVGTGASAIQIVPAIQPAVQHLTLFQRTAPWVMPRHDRALSARVRGLLRRVPGLQWGVRNGLYGFREGFGLAFRHPRLAERAERIARRHLRRRVPDPALRHVLTPHYRFGCKRVLLSDDYYPALTQPNVTVVDGAAVEVRPHGVVGPDGQEHLADVIVFATGFYVTEMPFARHVRGRDGLRLSHVWGPSPKAHLGTTVAGFPNLFVLQGPNTGLGHTSVLLMIEAQIAHVVHALRYMRKHRLAAVEPRVEAQAAFVDEVDRMAEGTVWTAGGCRSWYLDATGRNAALWPGSVPAFKRRVEPFEPSEYRLYPARQPAEQAVPVHA